MRVLLTGGCGYIGSVLTPTLLQRGYKVTVVDAQWFGNYLQPHPALTVIKADIRDGASLAGIDAVVHLAAVANDPSCDINPKLSWEVNVLATEMLADAAARANVRHFIYASSGSVYGVSDAPQVTEDTPLVPISDYNRTKMCAERIVLSYSEEMTVQVIRPATVCGLSPRMRFDVAVNALTIGALSRGQITVHGGEQYRPNLHISDMVWLYAFMLENPHFAGIYNAGFENLSIKNIAHAIAARFKTPIMIEPSNDQRSYRLNSDKLLATGFRPRLGIHDAISELDEAYNAGLVSDAPHHHNVRWMMTTGVA